MFRIVPVVFALLLLFAKCSSAFYYITVNGIDLFGNDIAGFSGVTYTVCQSKCESTSNCIGILFNTKLLICWLKNANAYNNPSPLNDYSMSYLIGGSYGLSSPSNIVFYSGFIKNVGPTNANIWCSFSDGTTLSAYLDSSGNVAGCVYPTQATTQPPSALPSLVPTALPTLVPTKLPTTLPTLVPTTLPRHCQRHCQHYYRLNHQHSLQLYFRLLAQPSHLVQV
jgi:hypothetical protein